MHKMWEVQLFLNVGVNLSRTHGTKPGTKLMVQRQDGDVEIAEDNY